MTNGNGLEDASFILCGEIKIDDRLRVGGMLYLEKKYEVSIGKIKFDTSLQTSLNLITALAIQRDVELTELDVKKVYSQLSQDQLAEVIGKIDFGRSAKNVTTPTRRKRSVKKKKTAK